MTINASIFVHEVQKRGNLAKQITDTLVATDCFDILTKKGDFIKIDENGNKYLITCIALKPNLTTIIQKAWEKLSASFQNDNIVTVTIQNVFEDRIIVDADGLRANIPLNMLSNLKITDARRYFDIDQEIEVRIVEIDPTVNKLTLSNVDTDTDPKKIIEQFETVDDEPLECIVEKITERYNVQTGIIVRIKDSNFNGFIPRSKATFSKFIELSSKYPVGSIAHARIQNFNAEYGRYTCSVDPLADPWQNISVFKEGSRINAIVRQISERHLLCELSEGVEGKVNASELSWNNFELNLAKMKEFKVGDVIEAIIINVNNVGRIIYLSIKRLSINPAEVFYNDNRDSSIEVTVGDVTPKGAKIIFSNNAISYNGYLPLSEISSCFCTDINSHIKTGDNIRAKLIKYDADYNNIVVSIKQITLDNYEAFKSRFKVGDIVNGVVQSVDADKSIIKVDYDNLLVESFVHKSEISNIQYIDDAMLKTIMNLKSKYTFIIKKFDDKHKVLELSRRQYFQKTLPAIKNSSVHSVQYFKIAEKTYYAFSDNIEAKIYDERNNVSISSGTINILVTNIDAVNNKITASTTDSR